MGNTQASFLFSASGWDVYVARLSEVSEEHSEADRNDSRSSAQGMSTGAAAVYVRSGKMKPAA